MIHKLDERNSGRKDIYSDKGTAKLYRKHFNFLTLSK